MVARVTGSPALMPYLAAMSLALALCLYGSGGVMIGYLRLAWICIGAGALLLFARSRGTCLAPRIARPLLWAWIALLLYTLLQTVPMPHGILSVLSPRAADLHDAVSRLAGGTSVSTISVMRAATMEHLARLTGYFLVFLIARELCWRADNRQWLTVAPLMAFALLEALLGIFQYVTGGGARSATGTYVNRNHFAGLLEMTFPFVVVYFYTGISSRNLARALVGATLGALLAAGILCSLSRMGAAILFGSCILMAAFLMRPLRIALPVVVTATVIGFSVLVPTQLLQRFASFQAEANLSHDTRVQLWNDTLRLASDYAVTGTGLGGYAAALPPYRTVELDRNVTFAHNDYLQIMAELGGVGAIPVGVLAICILHPVMRTLRRGTAAQRAFAAACLTSLLTMFVHSLADFNLYIPANATVLSWVAGVAVMLPWQPPHWTDTPPGVVEGTSRGLSPKAVELCVTERSYCP